MTETEKRPPGWGEAVEAASVAMSYPYRPDWNEVVLAKQALAAAWPVLAAALADQIREHAGPLNEAGVHIGVGAWRDQAAARGYTVAIGEVLDLFAAASVRSQGETE